MPKFLWRNAFERGPVLAQQRERLVARARIDRNDFGAGQPPVWRFKRLLADCLKRVSQRLAAV